MSFSRFPFLSIWILALTTPAHAIVCPSAIAVYAWWTLSPPTRWTVELKPLFPPRGDLHRPSVHALITQLEYAMVHQGLPRTELSGPALAAALIRHDSFKLLNGEEVPTILGDRPLLLLAELENVPEAIFPVSIYHPERALGYLDLHAFRRSVLRISGDDAPEGRPMVVLRVPAAQRLKERLAILARNALATLHSDYLGTPPEEFQFMEARHRSSDFMAVLTAGWVQLPYAAQDSREAVEHAMRASLERGMPVALSMEWDERFVNTRKKLASLRVVLYPRPKPAEALPKKIGWLTGYLANRRGQVAAWRFTTPAESFTLFADYFDLNFHRALVLEPE